MSSAGVDREGCLVFDVVQPAFPLSADHPQWGAADAEIKVPSGENTELKRSPFQAWPQCCLHRVILISRFDHRKCDNHTHQGERLSDIAADSPVLTV